MPFVAVVVISQVHHTVHRSYSPLNIIISFALVRSTSFPCDFDSHKCILFVLIYFFFQMTKKKKKVAIKTRSNNFSEDVVSRCHSLVEILDRLRTETKILRLIISILSTDRKLKMKKMTKKNSSSEFVKFVIDLSTHFLHFESFSFLFKLHSAIHLILIKTRAHIVNMSLGNQFFLFSASPRSSA